jgi:hypothetical protein
LLGPKAPRLIYPRFLHVVVATSDAEGKATAAVFCGQVFTIRRLNGELLLAITLGDPLTVMFTIAASIFILNYINVYNAVYSIYILYTKYNRYRRLKANLKLFLKLYHLD